MYFDFLVRFRRIADVPILGTAYIAYGTLACPSAWVNAIGEMSFEFHLCLKRIAGCADVGGFLFFSRLDETNLDGLSARAFSIFPIFKVRTLKTNQKRYKIVPIRFRISSKTIQNKQTTFLQRSETIRTNSQTVPKKFRNKPIMMLKTVLMVCDWIYNDFRLNIRPKNRPTTVRTTG